MDSRLFNTIASLSSLGKARFIALSPVSLQQIELLEDIVSIPPRRCGLLAGSLVAVGPRHATRPRPIPVQAQTRIGLAKLIPAQRLGG